ncbi:hypothetical protein H4R18_005915 [Coemansia javaensis]|uniref:Short-chain dehydrogenase n=1 Tax=Coemansia javaensis TaxID=2761396 RepID=A0A9W8LEN7_9FUNG|nr:hypothetical protein H4R18_005915 [Coemansia javaensis]
MQIAGSVAIVTGSARGIGRRIAEALVQRGARVVLGDVLGAAGAAVAAALNAGRGAPVAVFQHCDVTQGADLEALVARAEAEFGGADILVNNAGRGEGMVWADATSERLARCLDTNLRAPIDAARLVVRALLAAGRDGCVVNVASILAFEPQEFALVYSAAKAGLVAFTASCATLARGAPSVRVNAVAPVFVDTDMTSAGVPPTVAHALRSLGEVSVDDVVAQVVRCIEDESLAGDTIKVCAAGAEVARTAKPAPYGLVEQLKSALRDGAGSEGICLAK